MSMSARVFLLNYSVVGGCETTFRHGRCFIEHHRKDPSWKVFSLKRAPIWLLEMSL